MFASPPFFLILIGFSGQHISEKVILQRVDKYTQIQARELIEKEKNLENTEHNYEIALAKEGIKKELDQEVIQTFANYIFLIQDQEEEITEQIIELEHKISVDISKDLINLRFISDFFYEFLIGIALVEIISGDITSGIIFLKLKTLQVF